MNSVDVNLHKNYNNFANLHIFSLIDVGDFWVWMCKIKHIFLFCIDEYKCSQTITKFIAKFCTLMKLQGYKSF